MKCHSLRDAIVEMARGEHAGPGTVAAIESHLEHCAACAALLERERRLSQGLRALSAAAPAAPSEALSRRLLDAFAERQPAQPDVARGASRIAGKGWLRAAAAVLVAAGGVLLWSSAGNRPKSDRPRDASTCGGRNTDARSDSAVLFSAVGSKRPAGECDDPCESATSTLASTGASRSGATGRFCGLARCGGLARFRERRDCPHGDPADVVANLRNRDSARRAGLTCRGRFAGGAGWPGKGDSIGDDERVAMNDRRGALADRETQEPT